MRKSLRVLLVVVAVLAVLAIGGRTAAVEGARNFANTTAKPSSAVNPECRPGCRVYDHEVGVTQARFVDLNAVDRCYRTGTGMGTPDPCGGEKDVFTLIYKSENSDTGLRERISIGCGKCVVNNGQFPLGRDYLNYDRCYNP